MKTTKETPRACFNKIKDAYQNIFFYLIKEFEKRSIIISYPNSENGLFEGPFPTELNFIYLRLAVNRSYLTIFFRPDNQGGDEVRFKFKWPEYPGHDKYCESEYFPIMALENKKVLDTLSRFLNGEIDNGYKARGEYIEKLNSQKLYF